MEFGIGSLVDWWSVDWYHAKNIEPFEPIELIEPIKPIKLQKPLKPLNPISLLCKNIFRLFFNLCIISMVLTPLFNQFVNDYVYKL